MGEGSAGQTQPASQQADRSVPAAGFLAGGWLTSTRPARRQRKQVALKVLKAEHVEDERYVQRFDEMEILEHLDSPFAVSSSRLALKISPPGSLPNTLTDRTFENTFESTVRYPLTRSGHLGSVFSTDSKSFI